MKHLALATGALAVTASMASAAGIERRGDSSQILFEDARNYVEFSATTVHPNISGNSRPGIPAGPTGNITNNFESYGFGYKHQLNDRVALAFVIDEPVAASVTYGTPGAFFGFSSAEVGSIAFTAYAKYEVADRISVYGGLRYQGLKGDITIVSPATFGITTGPGVPYQLNVDRDFQFGYVLGAAYEIPEMALRVALTYESKIEHDFRDNTGASFDVEIPQAITLHARTGIAPGTLLFGSIKWREWSEFEVRPADFRVAVPGVGIVNAPIASEPDDIWTYELGVGRRFTDNWSGAATIGYEQSHDQQVGNLSGRDGYFSYGLAMSYENEDWKFTTGIRYFDVGSASSNVTNFSGNDAFGIGMKVGFKF